MLKAGAAPAGKENQSPEYKITKFGNNVQPVASKVPFAEQSIHNGQNISMLNKLV